MADSTVPLTSGGTPGVEIRTLDAPVLTHLIGLEHCETSHLFEYRFLSTESWTDLVMTG